MDLETAPQSLSEAEGNAYHALRYYYQCYNGGIEQVIYNCRSEIPAMLVGLRALGLLGTERMLRRASRLSWECERDDEQRALSRKGVAIRDALDDACLDDLPVVLKAILTYVDRHPELKHFRRTQG
jgi:hypothetical protein